MNVDSNYHLLVESLLRNKRSLKVYGYDIEIRPIPDADKRGILDPREYALALETLQNRVNTPHTIEAIRKQTGFPNRNLNTVQMEEDVLTINVKNRKIRVFKYFPRFLEEEKGKKPCFVYVHGGSWFSGSPFISENTCRYISEIMNAYVFNIEISLCPEHPFPASIEDTNETLKYIYSYAEELNIDVNRIYTIGDSSGANIILSAIQMGLPFNINTQILYYPAASMFIEDTVFDWKEELYEIDEAYRPFIIPRLVLGRGDGKGDMQLMNLIYSLYLQHGESRDNPLVSPLYSDVKKFPKTIIFTAEYDGLRLQDEYFGKLLKDAGVKCDIIRFNGVHHGFIDKIGVFPQAEASLKIMKEILNND